jgi:hypothetical protein
VATLISLHVVTWRWGGRRDLNGALELRASAEVGELLLRGTAGGNSGSGVACMIDFVMWVRLEVAMFGRFRCLKFVFLV